VLKCKRVFRVSKFSQRSRRWTTSLVAISLSTSGTGGSGPPPGS